MRQQPTFWLEIRKEYVIENYSALLPYLRGYQYDTRAEADDSDFNKTFNCLKEVVDDICQSGDTQGVRDRKLLGIAAISAWLSI